MKRKDAQAISGKVLLSLLDMYVENYKKNNRSFVCNGVGRLSAEIAHLWDVDQIICSALEGKEA